MDTNVLNQTISTSTFVWCFLMPLIHFLSLISNILCIIVFCSKTFIHKPIAIYFICLLISDSTTLLIGYSEMLDRESSMMNKSSLFCMFNTRIINNLTELIYTWMGKLCLEWMLYKILWTRASTILLAILSIQRARTFFSLSYRESRLCALLACLISILIALLITCLEWIGIQCEKSSDSLVYWQIFRSMMEKKSAKEFYSNYLSQHSSETYSCLNQIFTVNNTNFEINQFNCSTTEISSEFYSLTQSLVSNSDVNTPENIINILLHTYDELADYLTQHITRAKSPEIIIRLFEKRSCHISLTYSVCLKMHDFLHSLTFGFNRHTLAIFFGNAFPSFIVVLANLLSIKVIFFSKHLKYLQQRIEKPRGGGGRRRHRRFQNDLRAFLVILMESFSIITISWGIPIYLTTYYCQTLYVVSMAACPAIQKSLAIFLFTDLFNSSTNCLLYSLSGKLFRRQFIWTIKMITTCGRSVLWHVKPHVSFSPSHQLELQPSNELSITGHVGFRSRHFEPMESNSIQPFQRRTMIENPLFNNEQEVEFMKELHPTKSQRMKTVFRSIFRSTKKTQANQIDRTTTTRRRSRRNPSYSSSSSSSSRRLSDRNLSLRPNPHYSSIIVLTNSVDHHRSLTNRNAFKYITNI